MSKNRQVKRTLIILLFSVLALNVPVRDSWATDAIPVMIVDLQPQANEITLSLPDMAIPVGGQTTISLLLASNQEPIYSADIQIDYDSSVITALSAEKGNLVPDWMLGSNLETPGAIQVALAGSQPVSDDGELLRLTFEAIGAEDSSSLLVFNQGDLNEGNVSTQLIDGRLTVVERITGLAASNDSPTQLGETTTVTATVITGSDVIYEWALGDGATANDRVVSHIYPAVGNYNAIVTASNSLSTTYASTLVIIDNTTINSYLPIILRNR